MPRDPLRVQLKIIFRTAWDFHRYAACQEDFCLVGDEAWRWDNHLVARVEQGIHHQVERLRNPHRNENFVFRIVSHIVQATEMISNGLAQLQFAGIGGVMRFPGSQGMNARFQD